MKKLVVVFLLFLPLAAQGADQDIYPLPPGEHKFWDKTNIALHSLNAAIQIGEVWSTERARRHCRERGMPCGDISPLGNSREGRVLKGVFAFILPLGLSYVLHDEGYHKIERIMPTVFAVPSGIAVGWNLRF